MRVVFDQFELDAEAFELRESGHPVALEPQVLAVLAHLVARQDRPVPEEELLDEIWGDQFVSKSALTSRIKSARRALGDDGRTQRYIKTVHGRRYRFVGRAHPGEVTSRASTQAHNLPSDRTPLIGRHEEIRLCADQVTTSRFVSLIGLGGTGKTGLATTIGRHLVDRSLVVRLPGERTRYRLLESVKLFATEQTGTEVRAQLADRHARWCLDRLGDDIVSHHQHFTLAE